MYLNLIFLFSSLLVILPICSSDGDFLLDCYEEGLCGSEEGKRRGLQCISLLSQKDIDIMYETLNRRYPGTKDMKDILDEACLDLKKAKENIDYYFVEKDKLEVGYTEEESTQIITSRACLMVMVAECQLKKSMMGIFGR
ncbi:hypothetical protein TNCT_216771 [Trichonephila clavata]|uniref:Uncharacterized protein n=1 Tax=Trichonephila clavata TaxID=2740835 RepID=A0A8X6F187_TRICU|nr:hypothetical protein TNCT_216771 [Trichonephila clavata]